MSENIIKENIIKIEGFVEIRNGDTIIKAKNKFVQTILQHILNWLSMYYVPSSQIINGPTYNYNMYIGTDMTTPTAYNTSVLISPIGTVPGTAPNSRSGNVTNPSVSIYRMIITMEWNAGTVSGTVGEIALYLNMLPAPANRMPYQWAMDYTYQYNTPVLVSRLAVADGTFSSFTINTANPLTIVWTIQLSFA